MTATAEYPLVCRLLRGERTALQSYNRVLDRFGLDPRTEALKFIRAQHANSIGDLVSTAFCCCLLPESEVGSWRGEPHLIDGISGLFGDQSAIHCLLRGERALKADYETILGDEICRTPRYHALFSVVLLPRCERHVIALERLQQMFQGKNSPRRR